WFDKILTGEKTEEWREIKPYWQKRFFGGHIHLKGKIYHPADVIIRFSNGYHKGRRTLDVECKDLVIKDSYGEWNTEPGKQYYVLLLGRFIKFGRM
ncbi:MAG: hypothetical protein V5A47_12200, partial [Bacteroidales bacterium]